MLPFFHTASGKIPVLHSENSASESNERDVDITVGALLLESNYIPTAKYDTDCLIPPGAGNINAATRVDENLKLLESSQINRERLNAFLLQDLADVDIFWVDNICRHLMLSDEPGRRSLLVFEYPQVTQLMLPVQGNHPIASYMNEVWKSYAILFPFDEIMKHTRYHHAWIWRKRWCQCTRCKIRRKIFSDEHQSLRVAIETEAAAWLADDLPYLWGRIIKVKDELDKSKPATIAALVKDHRDMAQFYGMV
jgi:hypothetical protein